MANGKVYFWQDDNRLYPKPVFELTGAPPNYTYIQLPNPITLDAAGCFQNANGDNVAVYYYPYNQFGELELYYISAFDEDGLERFTRQAWPNVTSGTNPATTGNASMSNEISNGQFVDVLFDPSETLTISWGGSGTETAEIAPGWTIEVNHTGAANVQITRNPIAGSDLVKTNAPYTLTILPSSNINSLKLMQRLNHNTSLWSPVSAGIGGYLNAGILLGTGTQDIELLYRPDQGTEQSILMASNNTGAPFYYSETIQLDVADNSSSSDVGYIDFIIKLPQTGASTISSLQILGLESDENAVPYQQQTVDRQKDQLFHYYQPKIKRCLFQLH